MLNRKSNFELLRILLMCAIPLYHLMLYNGVHYVNEPTSIVALVLTVGGAIPADYAFMALSAYFMLESRYVKLKRFLFLAAQVLTLYIIKVVTLRGLFGYNNTEYFVDFFLMKGAWWYIYPYLVLSLIYPWLNSFIERVGHIITCLITVLFGCLFFYNGILTQTSFIKDMTAFLFIYFFMACMRNSDYKRYLGFKTNKYAMGAIALAAYLIMLGVNLYVKIESMKYVAEFGSSADGQFAMQGVIQSARDIFAGNITDMTYKGLINYTIGKYHFLSMIMGLAVFFMFRDIDIGSKVWINKLAKTTFYVFLLHDTWMGIFWKLGKCGNDFGYYSMPAFLLWSILYVASAFVVAGMIGLLYDRCIKPLWAIVINRILPDREDMVR